MDYYYTHCKMFFYTVGQWPHQSWLTSKLFQYFFIVQHMSIITPEVIRVYEYRKNVDLLIEAMPNVLYNIGIALKFINVVANKHKIKEILEKIKQDWDELQNNYEDLKILRDFYDSARSLITFYIALNSYALLSFMFLPLTPTILDIIIPLNESRPKFPLYHVEFFIDQDKYHFSILMHAYVTSLVGILPFFANDLFFCNCIHHACGLFTILGERLKTVLKVESNKGNLDNDKTYGRVADCAVRHQMIIEFCEDINNIYSTSFFLVLSICILEMSVTGVVAVIKLEEHSGDCLRFIFFTVAQIFHIFCYYFMAQKLLNYGDNFINYICESDWYLASNKTKYIVKFMIFRSLNHKHLHANIFLLSLENFTSVMKTSFSYFTLIRSTS